ncbi:MAG: SH3 domain-containing protein [Acidimicrobiaceae bacterium]|nr:SH3 domain-containing protein [Acidimicrobiaceae bacterium]
MTMRGWLRLIGGASLIAVAGACGGSGGHAASTTTRATGASTSSTSAVQQMSGSRTVLSPIGVNVRAKADRSAAVLGTAAQGVVLTVLGHTSNAGGWFEVKGSTVTGWISDDPTLSAPGEFRSYSSGQFSALYPASWTAAPFVNSVVFKPASGSGNIVVTSAASVAALPAGRAGYGQKSVSKTVVCGVTSDLVTYQRAASPASATPYLVQIRLPLDQHHALGIEGNLVDQGPQLQIFDAFLAAITFPFPECTGR